jgi:integrase
MSRRTIPLTMNLTNMLKAHRRAQNERRMKLGTAYQNNDLVFASKVGTPFFPENIRVKWFEPLLKKSGLPDIRLYDLRHTCATLLLLNGINPKVVSERLGHSPVVMTLDTYSHVLPQMQGEATDSLEMLLFSKKRLSKLISHTFRTQNNKKHI